MNFSKVKIGGIALSAMVLAACGSSSSDNSNEAEEDAQFEITTTNLTNAQTMSPVAVIMHNNGFHNFVDGETASVAVERLAEGGDNSQVLSAAASAEQYISSASTSGPVPPSTIGETVVLDVPVDQLSDFRLSVMTMLIRTNDGFTGLNGTDISNIEAGSSITFKAPTWDAGTDLYLICGFTLIYVIWSILIIIEIFVT